jgi:putative DNA methylase
VLTGAAIDDTHVKAEAIAGRMSAALMAIVAEGNRSRVYLAPNAEHVRVATSPKPPDVPEVDQPLPNDPRNFWTVSYGLDTFAKLFTPRQLVALMTFSDLMMGTREKVFTDAKAHWYGAHVADTRRLADGGLGPAAYADAVATYLGFAISRCADFWSSIATWSSQPKNELVVHTFGRQSIPMTWDYGEICPFSSSNGNFESNVEFVSKVVSRSSPAIGIGEIHVQDAQSNSFPGLL